MGGVALLGGFSLSGASRCRERLIGWGRLAVGRQRLTVRSFSIFVGGSEASHRQELLTVGIFSLFGGVSL